MPEKCLFSGGPSPPVATACDTIQLGEGCVKVHTFHSRAPCPKKAWVPLSFANSAELRVLETALVLSCPLLALPSSVHSPYPPTLTLFTLGSETKSV